MTVSLAGRTALVTGASRGIGRAIAEALAAACVRLTLLARRADALESLAVALGARAVACDVTEDAQLDRLFERVSEPPDILVNNAGRFELSTVEETSLEAFTNALDANLVAPFRLVRGFLPAMRARGSGDIVSVGSIADHTIFPGNAAYGASKHGLRALHDVLRTEMRGTGVRATLVSPGPVDTSIWDDIDPDSRDGFTPRAKMLTPNAVADAVMFAVSQPADVDIDLIRLSRS
ncbi:MAG: SDR family oxidoreductase [Gemmatimonadaceae bacterium]